MTRQDWSDAGSFDGPRRMRVMRAHGIRFLALLAVLFLWFLIVALVVVPVVEGRPDTAPPQAAEAAQSQ